MTARTTLPTRNTGYGFFGTALLNTDGDEAVAARQWDAVFAHLAGVFAAEPADVRNFLDSKWGRHLADDIHCGRGIAELASRQRSYFARMLGEFRRDRRTIESGCGVAA